MEQLPQRGNVPQVGVFHTPRLRNEKHHSEERVLRAGVADGPVAVHVSILTYSEDGVLLLVQGVVAGRL